MPYCSQCGVEVEKTIEKCPLCQAPIQKLPTEDDPGHPYPKNPSPIPHGTPMTMLDRLRLSRTITTFGILIPVLIVLAIDYFLNRNITWSAVVLSSLLLVWAGSVLPLFLHKRPFLMIGGLFVAVTGFLWFLDFFTKGREWFLFLGLPSAFIAGVLASVIVLLLRRKIRTGLHVAAWIVSAITIQAVVVDVLLSWFLHAALSISWSLIVAGACMPVVGLLFYLDSVSGRRSKLRRIFHL